VAERVCESSNGRFRDGFLACEQFNSLLEVQVLAEDGRPEYNTYRPHGSLNWLTPEAFRNQWITNNQHSHSTGLLPGTRSSGPTTGAQSAELLHRPLSKVVTARRARAGVLSEAGHGT
jgi:hypothetical protein